MLRSRKDLSKLSNFIVLGYKFRDYAILNMERIRNINKDQHFYGEAHHSELTETCRLEFFQNE